MNVIPALPSLEYLLDSKNPRAVCQQIELACLDHVAQHLKRARAEEDEARQYQAKADAARWLIETLPMMVETVRRMIDVQPMLTFPEKPEAEGVEERSWRPRYAGAPGTASR